MSIHSTEPTDTGNGIWPIGIDMDFGLDSSLSKNVNTHKNYGRHAMGSSYSDEPNTFFQRLDDFKDDILQITDLTNSLHKGDAESAQVLLNKMASQEIGEFSECLHSDHLIQNFAQQNTSSKNLYLPKDVYGKISYYNNKLVLQLRVIQETSNHFLNINECWICHERINGNTDGNSHRHTLHASFLSNSEYVQFDIDEFNPDVALNNLEFNGCIKSQLTSVSGSESTNSDNRNGDHPTTSDGVHSKEQSAFSNEIHLPFVPQNTDYEAFPSTNSSLATDSMKEARKEDNMTSNNPETIAMSKPNIPAPKIKDMSHKTEVGAKKRKSKVQKKSVSHIETNESSHPYQTSINTVEANPAIEKTIQSIPKICSVANINLANKCKTSKLAPKKKNSKIVCYICSEEFSNLSAYKNHVLAHGVSPSEIFSCLHCCKKFADMKLFYRHLRSHKAKDNTCVLCGVKYTRASKLRLHMETFHFQKRKFQCEICLKKFFRAEYLKKHMNIHNNIRFHCDQCPITCSTKFNLSEHKKIHLTPTAVTCDICSQAFPRKSMLESHIAKEHKSTKLECDICFKMFSRKDVLKRHRKIHDESQTKYTCSQCNKQFTREDKMKAHSKTHSITPTNLCPHCPATFKKKDIFQKHLNIHKTKEQCNICYKFLPTAARLQSHLRWHEKQIKLNIERKYLNNHKCEVCLKAFSSIELLMRHTARIHESNVGKPNQIIEREKKFFCDLCSKGFTRSCNLKSHMKMHNPAEDSDTKSDKPSVLSRSKIRKGPPTGNFTERDGTEFEPPPPRMLLDFDANKYNHFGYPPMLPTLEDSSLPYSSGPYGATLSDNHPSSTNVTSSPSSPINLSTDAITAAAYLLAYPSYPY